MKFDIRQTTLTASMQTSTDALLVLWSDGARETGALADWIGQARRQGDFKDTVGTVLQSYGMPGLRPRHVVAVACGQGSARDLRKAVRAAWGALRAAPVKSLTLYAAGPTLSAEALRALCAELADASYVYVSTLSRPEPRRLQQVVLGLPQVASADKAIVKQAQALVQGIELAKEWANRPANHATPSRLADAARALAKKPGIRCKVLGPREVDRLGMGAFAAVARGAVEPLRFIVLEYTASQARSEAPVVLIGKGITFDTGGISMKPAAEMDEMKFDMSGAASVLGVFEALAQLQPAVNVVGLIPATENMPDGQAVKPGDVVTSMSGQTIEILNTDAEGRLVLCDALTYAERFKPRAVIDIATLTGACVIALGAVRSGLFTADDALAQALCQAADDSGDLCWRMPLDEDYAEGLKSRFADVANVAGRAAGSVTAAKFLQRFAGRFPWAHLDIAGTAWRSGTAKGATGRPVGLLLHYLLAQQPAPKSTRRRATAAS
jgi:leucyl aminopeptidase